MAKRKKFPDPVEFKPRNPEKYSGKYPIMMRSSWETHFANKLDEHENVLSWASESIVIQYHNPIKDRKARYYTDFVVEFIDNNRNTVTEVIEVKPYEEAHTALLLMESRRLNKQLPGIASTSKNPKTRAYQDATTVVNAAKWEAAKHYCQKMGYVFRIMTEKQLFGRMK